MVNYFITVLLLGIIAMGKLHRSVCGDRKILNAIVENLWLVSAFFWFVNHWAAFTIAMPYIVK